MGRQQDIFRAGGEKRVKHSCGHEFVHHFTGEEIRFLGAHKAVANYPCPNCTWNATSIPKQERELVSGINVNLTGSDKQVQWGYRLREQALTSLENTRAVRERIEKFVHAATTKLGSEKAGLWVIELEKAAKEAYYKLLTERDSTWFIMLHQKKILDNYVMKAVEEKYEETKPDFLQK